MCVRAGRAGGGSSGCLLQHLRFPLPPRTHLQDGLAILGRRAAPPGMPPNPFDPNLKSKKTVFSLPTFCYYGNTLLENTCDLSATAHSHLPRTAGKPT